MLKSCRWCKNEIIEQALVCPACGRRQKWIWHYILEHPPATISIIFVLISLGFAYKGYLLTIEEVTKAKEAVTTATAATKELHLVKQEIESIAFNIERTASKADQQYQSINEQTLAISEQFEKRSIKVDTLLDDYTRKATDISGSIKSSRLSLKNLEKRLVESNSSLQELNKNADLLRYELNDLFAFANKAIEEAVITGCLAFEARLETHMNNLELNQVDYKYSSTFFGSKDNKFSTNTYITFMRSIEVLRDINSYENEHNIRCARISYVLKNDDELNKIKKALIEMIDSTKIDLNGISKSSMKENIYDEFAWVERRNGQINAQEEARKKQDELRVTTGVSISKLTTPDTYLINFRDGFEPPLLFEKNSHILTDSKLLLLQGLANELKIFSHPNLLIHGHSASDEDNSGTESLSLRRAKFVKDYIISKGIEPVRLIIRSDGSSLPIGDNLTDNGKRLNRRVEITLFVP